MTNVVRPFPVKFVDVHSEWVSAVLREAQALEPDEAVEIEGSEPVGLGETYASALHRLTLSGPPGAPSSLIIKLAVEGGIRPMLDAIGVYRREVVFYEELAEQSPLRTPRCFFAALADDSTDFVIVMEDLAPRRSADQLKGLTLDQARMGDNLGKQTALTEKGELNNGVGDTPNRHDMLTGSQPDGRAYTDSADHTCGNWTSNGAGTAQLGHSDRNGGGNTSWNSAHASRGCSQDNLVSTGGAGMFYCFATN